MGLERGVVFAHLIGDKAEKLYDEGVPFDLL